MYQSGKLSVGTFLSPTLTPVYQAVTGEIGRQLSIPIELVEESDYENFAKDKYDLCFICSLPYLNYERQGAKPAIPIAAPVLKGKRYEGRPVYFSDVIVRCDSPFNKFEDLRGHSWCYNEEQSLSGYCSVRSHLLELGETRDFFSRLIKTGFHAKSIQMVVDGKVDSAAIDSQVLSAAIRDYPSLHHKLRIIESIGPSTAPPITISKRLPDDIKQKVLTSLLSMHHSPANRSQLDEGLIKRFVAVDNASYDKNRNLLEICRDAHFITIRKGAFTPET